MSAPYPTEDTAAYREAAPYYAPSLDNSAYQPASPDQVHFNQQQAYAQPGYQPSSNTVIVTQPKAPVETYPIEDQSRNTGCGVGALVLSIGACLCTCWPIGLIALILAGKIS